MAYSNETIAALATLREFTTQPVRPEDVIDAINELDNAGVFRALDEQTDYATTDAQWADVAAGEQHLRETEPK